jgi:hypothetical protein
MKQAMIKLLTLLVAVVTIPAYGANAAPLGMEVGVATLAQVKQQMGSKTKLVDAGMSKFTGGRMLESEGQGLEVEGLSAITWVFDANEKLAGVIMHLPKQDGFGDLQNGFFKKTLNTLASKYKLVEKRVPFVGDAYAKLKQDDSIIEIEAPHMSLKMELRYMTNDLKKAYLQQLGTDSSAKARNQASKL